ncbi:CU044_2847 family protein [Bradyrhizobium sp. HKCCYLS1011]|uniref:CU044_2847 family protein n=1 Tax=Bradyrhizobium sp. HKCCYLS1011 TaxID=3420733 RepID=UPI003EBA360C
MPARMIVEFPDGAKVHFGKEPTAGLAEVGIGEEIATATSEQFKAALGSLAHLVGALEDALKRLQRLPDKVEMEFGASLSGKCDLWVVAGDGKADFKVKLAWEKPK